MKNRTTISTYKSINYNHYSLEYLFSSEENPIWCLGYTYLSYLKLLL
jgi:hypothetical protein